MKNLRIPSRHSSSSTHCDMSAATPAEARAGRLALGTLAAEDRYALYELVMHCRDRGHPLARAAQAPLARRELLIDGAVPETVRAVTLATISGHGLAMRVRGARTAEDPSIPTIAKLRELARTRARAKGGFGAPAMSRWTAAAASLTDRHGRVTPELQKALHYVETTLGDSFTKSARAVFQDLVATIGAKLHGKIQMPRRRTPYWIKGVHPLANFQSAPALPAAADVVIIGAGLTGASAAYHLSAAAEKGLRVVILDSSDPAMQASGRNGGNFELIPENYFGRYGTYDGFAMERYKFLKAAYPDLDDQVLRAQAQRIAETIIRFAITNTRRMLETIESNRIDCDLSTSGWLRIAMNHREEVAIKEEVALARKLGADIHLIQAATIRQRYNLPAEFLGRMVRNNGNYHPFKFVCGELQCAIGRGVQLYTRTPVQVVLSKQMDAHEVQTARGTIQAKKVIVATNAFTSRLFPELSAIRYFRSQLANFEHVEDNLAGITMTAKDGDIYANFPGQDRYLDDAGVRRGTLHIGGGVDTEAEDPADPIPTRAVFNMSRQEVEQYFRGTERQPATRVWAGPMGFVEGKHGMRIPALGPLGSGARQGVFIAVWCNGFGSTGCHNSGAGAAEWALTGEIPHDMPQDVFGVARLLGDEPQFPSKLG